MIVLSFSTISKRLFNLQVSQLTKAIKKTLKHSANEIRPNLTPVGYSTPSWLVLILVKTSSLMDGVFSSFSSLIEAVLAVEPRTVESSASPSPTAFSVTRILDALLSVEEVESGIAGFSSTFAMFDMVKE